MAKKSAKKSPAKKSPPPKPAKSVRSAKPAAVKPAGKSAGKTAAAKPAAKPAPAKAATGVASKLVKVVKKVVAAITPHASKPANGNSKAVLSKAPVVTAKKPTPVPATPTKQAKSAGPSLAIKSAAPHSMSGKPGLLASQKVAQVSGATAGVLPLKKKKKKVLRPDEPPVRLPPPPVTSDSKMQKNRAGLTPKELEHFRDLLLEKRRELLGDVTSMERDALRSGNTNLSTLPVHMADSGTDNYEQEFTLGLVEKERQLLREINVALAKIQDGSYGLCEGTGKPISKPRLEAQPWARYSIEHARALEKPMFRRAY